MTSSLEQIVKENRTDFSNTSSDDVTVFYSDKDAEVITDYKTGQTFAVASDDHELSNHAQNHQDMQNLYIRWLERDGSNVVNYLRSQGKHPKMTGIGSKKLPQQDAVAAVLSSEDQNIVYLVGNENFVSRAQKFADNYSISIDDAFDYIFGHETVHMAGVHAEKDTELTLAGYFMDRVNNASSMEEAGKYLNLAIIATYRSGDRQSLENLVESVKSGAEE